MSSVDALERLSIAASSLMAGHAPRFRHPNKELLYALACPPRARHAGIVHASRWPSRVFPPSVVRSPRLSVEARPDFFDYPASAGAWAEWHLNFADPEVFGFGRSALFAQDEMQIGEHPALDALREHILRTGEMQARTVDDGGEATPFLVAGVERRVAVATDRHAAEGRPFGLYGNAFARADEAALRRAIQVIDPPTPVNILAIAAPRPGHGTYSKEQIERVLVTAYSGFASARDESTRLWGEDTHVSVHTGHWGCGAFGGNRELMGALQLIAAYAAGIPRFVFHGGDDAGCHDFRASLSIVRELLPVDVPRALADVIQELEERTFCWGERDGN